VGRPGAKPAMRRLILDLVGDSRPALAFLLLIFAWAGYELMGLRGKEHHPTPGAETQISRPVAAGCCRVGHWR